MARSDVVGHLPAEWFLTAKSAFESDRFRWGPGFDVLLRKGTFGDAAGL